MQFSAARINRARNASSAMVPAAKSNSDGAGAGSIGLLASTRPRACVTFAGSIRKINESTNAWPNRVLIRKINSELMCCSCFCQIASATETISVLASSRNGIACGRKPAPAARDQASFTASSGLPPLARSSFGRSFAKSTIFVSRCACVCRSSHSESKLLSLIDDARDDQASSSTRGFIATSNHRCSSFLK